MRSTDGGEWWLNASLKGFSIYSRTNTVCQYHLNGWCNTYTYLFVFAKIYFYIQNNMEREFECFWGSRNVLKHWRYFKRNVRIERLENHFTGVQIPSPNRAQSTKHENRKQSKTYECSWIEGNLLKAIHLTMADIMARILVWMWSTL